MNKLETLAMVDVAEHLLKENKEPMEIQTIFKEVALIKGISLDDVDKLTQLYMDITQSGKFVYCGDDKWDLKIGNLHLWDDDGSAFITVDEELDEEEIDFVVIDEEEEFEEEILEEEDEEELDEDTKAAIKEEKEYIEVELPLTSTDDDDVDFDTDLYDDEEDYNEIMDDYEDMYDE